MKAFVLCAALMAFQNTASANIFGCGYGNLYKYLKCEVTSSATYEAGYTEVYGHAELYLDYPRNYYNPVKFSFGREAGNLQGEFRFVDVGANPSLKMQFSLPLRDSAQQVSFPVEFPAGCNAETPSVQFQTRYVADFPHHSSELDLTVSCTAGVEFEKD